MRFLEKGKNPKAVASGCRGMDPKGGKLIDQFHIISLLSVEANIFFSAVSNQICTYLSENTYIDKSVQKGRDAGIPCCLEHTGVVTQLIREARKNKSNLSVLWLDLAHAYGFIPHKLVQHTLTR